MLSLRVTETYEESLLLHQLIVATVKGKNDNGYHKQPVETAFSMCHGTSWKPPQRLDKLRVTEDPVHSRQR